MNENEKNKFLDEIHRKINKRSKGLYYNNRLERAKKNLFVTALVLILVVIIWGILNFYYGKTALSKIKYNKKQNSSNSQSVKDKKINVKHQINQLGKKPKDEKTNPANREKYNKHILKEKYRYIVYHLTPLTENDSEKIYKILKKYKKIDGKDYYLYLIKDEEMKNILKSLIKIKNLKLKKEKYNDRSNYNELSVKKEILDIILKK